MATSLPPTTSQDADSLFVAEHSGYIRNITVRNSQEFKGHLHYINMDIDDLVQECMLCALEARRSYQPERGTTLRSWVIRCVRNFIFERRSQCWCMHGLVSKLMSNYCALTSRCPEESNKYVELLSVMAGRLSDFDYRVLVERTAYFSWESIARRLCVPVCMVRAARGRIRVVISEVLDITCD